MFNKRLRLCVMMSISCLYELPTARPMVSATEQVFVTGNCLVFMAFLSLWQEHVATMFVRYCRVSSAATFRSRSRIWPLDRTRLALIVRKRDCEWADYGDWRHHHLRDVATQ